MYVCHHDKSKGFSLESPNLPPCYGYDFGSIRSDGSQVTGINNAWASVVQCTVNVYISSDTEFVLKGCLTTHKRVWAMPWKNLGTRNSF